MVKFIDSVKNYEGIVGFAISIIVVFDMMRFAKYVNSLIESFLCHLFMYVFLEFLGCVSAAQPHKPIIFVCLAPNLLQFRVMSYFH